MNNTITVLMLEPGKEAYITDIEISLESMQQIVGGYIETFYPFEDYDVCAICNEEGKINGLPLNRAIYDTTGNMIDIVAGTCFLCDDSGEEFGSLSEELLEKYRKMFLLPEIFLRLNGKIVAVKYEPEKATLTKR